MIIDLYSDKANIRNSTKEMLIGNTDIDTEYIIQMLENSTGHGIYVHNGASLTLEQYKKINKQHNLGFTNATSDDLSWLNIKIEHGRIYCIHKKTNITWCSKEINDYIKEIIGIRHNSHKKIDVEVDADYRFKGRVIMSIGIKCEIDERISLDELEVRQYKVRNTIDSVHKAVELFSHKEYLYSLDRHYMFTYRFMR